MTQTAATEVSGSAQLCTFANRIQLHSLEPRFTTQLTIDWSSQMFDPNRVISKVTEAKRVRCLLILFSEKWLVVLVSAARTVDGVALQGEKCSNDELHIITEICEELYRLNQFRSTSIIHHRDRFYIVTSIA